MCRSSYCDPYRFRHNASWFHESKYWPLPWNALRAAQASACPLKEAEAYILGCYPPAQTPGRNSSAACKMYTDGETWMWKFIDPLSLYIIMLDQGHGQIVWSPLGFIEWATVLRLFGCLVSFDGPLVTNSLFLAHPSPRYVAWAVASFSRVEGGDAKHTFMGGLGGHTHPARFLVPILAIHA